MLKTAQILWQPTGQNLPSLGSKSLVDISDGDTPNIRMPIRMLSIDTPEVTARSLKGASKIDKKFKQLATWIREGKAPVSQTFQEYILPKLENKAAGTLQYKQGKEASAYYKTKAEERLKKNNSTKRRKLFIRMAHPPFDHYGRLLAYVAPSYSYKERQTMSRHERATFNLDMIESGWAAPFILYPNIPGELDLPLFIETAVNAKALNKGQYQDPLSLPGYEYRMCEKLYDITKRIVAGETLSAQSKMAWRSRYCVDMRDRRLVGPEQYINIPEAYRLWIWPNDVAEAIGKLNLVPINL